MGKKESKPKALRQVEDCMNDHRFEVNDAGQLVMTHPDGFTRSKIELLKILMAKQNHNCHRTVDEA